MILRPLGYDYLPYQYEGIQFAAQRDACLIADEMGLGKTVQAIGWMNAHPETESCLVVCPASLKINWAREMERWLVSPCVEITIVNYDMLHKFDFSKVYDVVVLDEAHYIKNKSARRSKFCRLIKAKNKIALSGTPILNKPIELWHILHWLDPILWPASSHMKYALRYCGAYKGKWGWVMDGATHLDELREKHLSYLMIRRLKADVLKELPPKRRQIIELPANGLTYELKSALSMWEATINYEAQTRKLEDVISCAWQEMAEIRHQTALAKVKMAIQIIQDAIEASGKVVVFAHHRDVIAELVEGLVDYHPAVITGSTPQLFRQQAVDMFQRGPDTRVFIGNVQAAGVGLTLTAASHVIFVELDWTPGLVSQAEDRCHRIGQTDSVLVQHLVLEDSLDARMAKALVRKQSIIEKALDAGKGAGHV